MAARGADPVDIDAPVIGQRVAGGGDDDAGRQVREVAVLQRREGRIGRGRGPAGADVVVIGHVRRRQAWGVGMIDIGPARHVAAETRVDQQLSGDPGSTFAAADRLGDRRGQVAARAVARKHEVALAPVERPGRRRHRIVEMRGVRMFRRQAIVDGHHAIARFRADLSADAVVAVETPHHEPAAVEVKDRRPRFTCLVDAHRHAVRGIVAHLDARRAAHVEFAAERVVEPALFGDREIHRLGRIEGVGAGDEGAHLGVEKVVVTHAAHSQGLVN